MNDEDNKEIDRIFEFISPADKYDLCTIFKVAVPGSFPLVFNRRNLAGISLFYRVTKLFVFIPIQKCLVSFCIS